MTVYTSIFQMFRFLVWNTSFQNAASVTPSDSEDLSDIASALWIGSTGALKVDLEGEGTEITFAAVPAGLFRSRVKRVYATGTSAGNIVALY